MTAPKFPKMLCARCGRPIGTDVYIAPSGSFFCKACHVKKAAAPVKGLNEGRSGLER